MMQRADRPPFVVEAARPDAGRAATIVFLHGYDDEAQGLPLGIAREFQTYKRAEYLRWVLPNAPYNKRAATTAWFVPRRLPNGAIPFVPGEVIDTDDEDDEEGILQSVDALDELVDTELAKGTPPDRLLVGGFSQGCVISLVWSVVGRNRNNVAGVMPMCGYFPLGHRLEAIRLDRNISDTTEEKRKWYYIHGRADLIVPWRMYEQGQEILARWVGKDRIETRLIDGLGHTTNDVVLRGMLRFFNAVIPP
jgi:predicted esterase